MSAFSSSNSPKEQSTNSWQRARELLLAAAEHGGALEAVTRQVEAALFLEARLVSQAARPSDPSEECTVSTVRRPMDSRDTWLHSAKACARPDYVEGTT
jgi:hypothetical protein